MQVVRGAGAAGGVYCNAVRPVHALLGHPAAVRHVLARAQHGAHRQGDQRQGRRELAPAAATAERPLAGAAHQRQRRRRGAGPALALAASVQCFVRMCSFARVLYLAHLSATGTRLTHRPLQAPEYRVQAARRLVDNHEAVTRFALRGAPGTKAGKHFSAPLSDPSAQPSMQFEQPVAAALCCTAAALLRGTDAAQAQFGDLEWLQAAGASQGEAAAAVRGSLEYLRDRVGVPRDLRLPAARQLRAHLNWTLDLLPS